MSEDKVARIKEIIDRSVTTKEAYEEVVKFLGPPPDVQLLLSFIGSLTLCDHLGDVANDVVFVLERLGIETPQADEHSDFWPGLARDLDALGVTTLYGTKLYDPEDEDEDDE